MVLRVLPQSARKGKDGAMTDSKRPILRLKAGAAAAPVLRVEYRVVKQEPEAEWQILRNGVDTGKSRRKKQSAIDLAILDARAELEMRAFDPDVFARAKATIQGCAGPGTVQSEDGSRHRCQVTVTGGDQTPPWPRNRATDDLLQIWLDAGKELGLRCRSEERGGLSDGNVLCDLFPTLDGLGPRGDNSHCSERSADGSKEQEWVDVTSFAPKAALNVRAIVSLLQRAASD